MKIKRLVIALLLCLITACTAMAFACSSDESSSGGFNGFKEGHVTKITVGEDVLIEALIDKPSDLEEYELNASMDEQDTVDLSDEYTWTPSAVGTWTITYKIVKGSNKGTYKLAIDVVSSRATWSFSNKAFTFAFGSTLSFNDFYGKENLDIKVSCYNNEYTPFIEKVQIGEDGSNIVYLDESATEFTFTTFETHYFTFGVKTPDGQVLKSITPVNVCESDFEAIYYCEDNDISYYGYKKLYYRDGDLSAELVAGAYTGYYENSDVPYVAFEGNYGENEYVTVDFTGNNLPKVAFFCNSLDPSLTNASKGIYVSNGTVRADKSWQTEWDWSNYTVYGPYKMQSKHVDTGSIFSNKGTMAQPETISRTGLENAGENVKYRYIVGITNADASAGTFVLNALLINLDTNHIVFEYSKTQDIRNIKNSNGKPLNYTSFPDNYFNGGNIMLYGSYGVETKWDKIYLPQNASSIYELDTTIRFLSTAPDYAIKNESVSVDDYISATDKANADVYYSANGKALTPFTGDLTFTESGEYVISIVPNDSSKRTNSMTVYVNESLDIDFEDGVVKALATYERAGAYLETENPISGNYSGKYFIRRVLTGNYAKFGLNLDFLERIFADPTVDSIAICMRADADTRVTPANGNTESTWASVSYDLTMGKNTFVTVTRTNYENSKNSSMGIYAFLLKATKQINQMTILVDDIRVGRTEANVNNYVYSNGNDLSITLLNTPSKVYINGDEITANISGKTVTIPASVLQDYAGTRAQVAIVTDVALTTLFVRVESERNIFVLDEDIYRSDAEESFYISEKATSVKIGDEDIPFESENNKLYIKKADLINYKGKNTLTVTTASKTFKFPINVSVGDIDGAVNSDNTVLTGTNIGAITKVETIDGTTEGAKFGDTFYKVELPSGVSGDHEIRVPIAYLKELFDITDVVAIKFYVALSFDTPVSGSEQSKDEGADKGVMIRVNGSDKLIAVGDKNTFGEVEGKQLVNLQKSTFISMYNSNTDYVFTINGAKHANLEYFYLDIGLWGFWSDEETIYVDSTENAGGITVSGIYGQISDVKNNGRTASILSNCTVVNGTAGTTSTVTLPANYSESSAFIYADDGNMVYRIMIKRKSDAVTSSADAFVIETTDINARMDVYKILLNGNLISGLDGITLTDSGVEIAKDNAYLVSGNNRVEIMCVTSDIKNTTFIYNFTK